MSNTGKWALWALMIGTAGLATAAPRMALAVMLPEIREQLELSLLQTGLIWGADVLTGVVSSVLGGTLSDRYGARTSLVVACVGTGLFGMARGLVPEFGWLLACSLLTGPFINLIPLNLHKAGAQIFPRRQLSISNAGVSVGMASGFMLGAITAATYLSPWLGSWRMVLALFGGLGVLFGCVWLFIPARTGVDRVAEHVAGHNFTAGLQHVAKLRDIRLMTLANFGYGACVNSMLGYVPLFLRNVGWAGPRADLAVSLFHVASLVATLPFSVWSDQSGHRRHFMLAGSISLSLATLAIPLVPNQSVFAVMVVAGLMRDAFMSIMITRLMESEGVGPAYAGSAMGLSMVGMQLGGAVAPAAGNALAALGPGRPFQFWSLLGLSAAALFWLVGDRRDSRQSDS